MENFFYIGSQLDEVKIKDLLLSRYGTFNLELELIDFCEIVMLAIEEKKRAEKREEWLALLPLMVTAGKYKSFEEYYDLASGKGIDLRSAEDIIADIDAAHERAKKDGT